MNTTAMKSLFYYPLIALLCVFTSCSKSDNAPNGSTPGEGGQVSGTYWPLALNNRWTMVNPEDPSDQSANRLIHKTITHEGKTYFQFKPLNTAADENLKDGIREENGLFVELHGGSNASGQVSSAGIITSINTKLKVGETWKDEMTLKISGVASGTIKHINEGKILEKAASVTINGKTYKDVLKTELKKTILISSTNSSLKITYETWLANGIGPVYEKETFENSESVSYGLVSYTVK